MPKYIDAEKLEKDGWSASRTYQQDAKTMVYETKKMTEFPAADVEEVKHAEWIVKDIHSNWADWEICTCKQCKTEYKNLYPKNFCPNCGAIMDL